MPRTGMSLPDVDVSDRQEIETRYREPSATKWIRTVLPLDICELLTEPVFCCTTAGKMVYANAAAQEWCQRSLIGQPFLSLLIPESTDKGTLFFHDALLSTPQSPTIPWELAVNVGNTYNLANFRGYLKHDRVVIVAQIENERDSSIHQQMLALTSDLAESQRKLHLQNLSLINQIEDDLLDYRTEMDYQKLALDEHCIMCKTDPRGTITYVNKQFCQISQYRSDELLGNNLSKISSGFHSRAFFHAIWKTIRRGKVWHGEVINRKKDGSLLIVNSTVVPFLDMAGKPYQYIIISTDITASKQAKELEGDRNLVLEMIARNQELPDILMQIVLMLRHQRPDVLCAIWLLRDGAMHYEAGSGLTEEEMRPFQATRLTADMCPSISAVSLHESVLLNNITDTAICQRCHHLAIQKNLYTCWSVPVISKEGNLLGMITMHYQKGKEPTQDDMHLAYTASNLVGIAQEQQILTEKLLYQSYHDTMTNLPNRFLFEDRLTQALAHANQYRHNVAVLFADLDRFKQINNTLGHSIGDTLLWQVAQRLKQRICQEGTLARMGDDEFALLLPEVGTPHDAVRVAQRLLDSLKDPFQIEEYNLYVTASIGISLYPNDGEDGMTIQRHAETAMHRAKGLAYHNMQFFAPEMNVAALDQLEMETHLRQVLDRNELQLHYQPQYAMDGTLLGVEALLRWQNPTLGYIRPSTFIPLAEETGLIVPIGRWVLHEALRQIQAWQQAGYPSIRMAINVSAIQLACDDFVETVSHALVANHVKPCSLEIELTESTLMQNYERLSHQLSQLRNLGVRIAIDDFGTGYSSLSHLQQLPIDTLKIDQSFVAGIGNQSDNPERGLSIITAIIMLAHSLNMNVVAEGVETPEQLMLLRNGHCDIIQGRLCSMALPASDLEHMLANARTLSDLLNPDCLTA